MADTEKTEKGKNGGRRPGSGRKPAINEDKLAEVKQQIEAHARVSVRIEGEIEK